MPQMKKRILTSIHHYLNPLNRLGINRYSFLFPFFGTLFFFSLIEVLSATLLKNSGFYSVIVITTSIVLIIYFAFRDSFKGGYIATILTILYYFSIIYSHHYTGAQKVSGIQTTIILGLLYAIIATIIGFLKRIIDELIMQEMQARFQAEERQQRIDTIMQQLPVGVLITTKKEKSVEGNRQLRKILGRSTAEFLRNDTKESPFVSKNNRHLFPKEWPITKALVKGETVKSEEIEYIRGDKKRLTLQVSAAPIKNKKGSIIAAVSTIADITERKQREEAARRLAVLVESSEDAIISKTTDGVITSWNKSAERLLGYTARQAIGQHINLIVPPHLREQEEDIMKKLRSGIGIEHFETTRLKKNGKEVAVSMSISPIKNNKGKVIGASNITRDITHQKELEKQKDTFIGIASHELKTPVTSLKGFTQVLQVMAKAKGDEKSELLLNKMDAQMNKLTSLIEDLLDSTKIQSGQLALNISEVNFDKLVRDVVASMQLTTDKHTLRLSGIVGQTVYTDKDRIEQVLVNFLSNAIKYAPQSPDIFIRVSREGEKVQVAVQDFGIGIPDEKKTKVFQQFFRVSGPYAETFPGLGLGLYISSQIIKRLHGKIWVESRSGKGSTFYFQIPLREQKST